LLDLFPVAQEVKVLSEVLKGTPFFTPSVNFLSSLLHYFFFYHFSLQTPSGFILDQILIYFAALFLTARFSIPLTFLGQ